MRGMNRLHTLYLRLFYRFDYLGRGVSVAPSCEIRRAAAPYIFLGDGVQIDKDVWLNIPYEAGPFVKGRPLLQIGDRTAVGRRCFFTAMRQIHIGRDVLFGPGVLLADHSHRFEDPAAPIIRQGVTEPGSIIIEDGCWFGYHSAVVTHKGREIRIGRNSVIGANAVVTRSCPPYSVLVGNPARIIPYKND